MSNDQESESKLVLWAWVATAAIVFCALVAGLYAGIVLLKNARSEKDISVSFTSYDPWPESIRDTFRNTLIHDGGRPKPIHSFARFTLMSFSGSSTMKFQTADGEKHSTEAVGWLLDLLFRGQMAKEMPTFVVDNTEILVAIGIDPAGKSKRDRYSYKDLLPARQKLAELGAEFREKQENYENSEKDPQYELTSEEGMILRLANGVSSFEFLHGQFVFARNGEGTPSFWPPELKEMAANVDPLEMLDKLPEMELNQLMAEVQRLRQNPSPSEDDRLYEAALSLMFFYANSGRGVSLFPPENPEERAWHGVGDLLIEGLASKEARPAAKNQLGEIAELVGSQKEMWPAIAAANKERATEENEEGASEDEVQEMIAAAAEPLRSTLASFSDHQKKLATEREEAGTAGLEVHLYTSNYFFYSLVFFIFGFVLLSFSWLSPGSKVSKWLIRTALFLVVAGLVIDVAGIVIRSVIRGRPPITNLYDTVIFITAIAVIVALLLEWVNRKGIGLLAAVICGVGGMFLSIRYEVKDAKDTMDPLLAVLDTNFWLATHVTAINIGYAAGMLAAILSVIYLVGRFFEPRKRVIGALRGTGKIAPGAVFDAPKEVRTHYRDTSRMVYGVVCFCLFFSLVGTVLGGIWANYSWGRFWGWDPKENGALMICLWTLVILHARMGGYLREIGINVATVILGVIVTFSWWGVNNLGVGLHSYGFTDGVWPALYVSWGVALVVMLCGLPLWMADRSSPKRKKRKKSAPPVSDKDSGRVSGLPDTA